MGQRMISQDLLARVKENIFGFATSNTFTYCDVTDTSFLNKVIPLLGKYVTASKAATIEITMDSDGEATVQDIP